MIGGTGHVVAEFFDRGYSRRTASPDRPHAATLLSVLTDADRGGGAAPKRGRGAALSTVPRIKIMEFNLNIS